MNDQQEREALPPLPEPEELGMDFDKGWDGVKAYGYTADQMHAYARAALAATPAPAPGWQSIETAPKDGSTIMLWEMYESEPFFGYWWEGRSRWRASTTHYDTDGNACVIDRIYSDGVTHWMPLPAAPEGQGKEASNG